MEKEPITKESPLGNSTAVFAAGCFWGVEEAFANIPGVLATEVGYTGGTKEHPTYEDVCSHTTGHAEALKITFDPKRVSYAQLIDIFWSIHDPTTLNRQGPDVGSQYRSAIFYSSPEQKKEAEESKNNHQQKLKKPIVTEITPLGAWWKAEEYHQQYFQKKGGGGVCHI